MIFREKIILLVTIIIVVILDAYFHLEKLSTLVAILGMGTLYVLREHED